MTGLRRSGFSGGSLSYAEVGASQLPDLLQFPPNGASVFFDAAKLGSGEQRFAAAVQKLMTWQAFNDAGFQATPLEQTAAAGADAVGSTAEAVYGADGTAYLTAGTQAQVAVAGVERVFTVVRVMQTHDVAGIVLGTADAGEFTGEVSLSVEKRADGNIWAFARGFWHEHAKRFLGLGHSPAETAKQMSQALLKALAPQALLLSAGDLAAEALKAAGVAPGGVVPAELAADTETAAVGVAIRSHENVDAADYEEAE